MTDVEAQPIETTSPAQETSTDSKLEAKFTQKDMDKIAGNRAKESAESTRRALLKDLGFDPDDAKAIETIKGSLSAFKQSEEAKKTLEDKLQEQINTLTKERDDAKNAAAQAAALRRADLIDSRLKDLALTAKAQIPSDVIDYLNKHHAAEVSNLLNETNTFDEKAAAALIETVKKVRGHWFGIAGMGTMSLQEGRTTDISQQDKQRGVLSTTRAIKRGF